MDLFASHESSHCQLYFSLTEGPLGIDALAHSWPQALLKYAFPPVSLLAQTLCAPAYPDLVSQIHCPRDSPSLEHSSEEGPPLSGARHHMAPASRSGEPPCVTSGRNVADLSGLPLAVVETITQARAPSTRQRYAQRYPALALLCPTRALRTYVARTRSFRSFTEAKSVSKQRLAHWIVDAVALAYQSQGEPCPLGVRAHSTWSVASPYALAHGASLADICRAAGWATQNTFARFYSLRVEPVSSRVLGNR